MGEIETLAARLFDMPPRQSLAHLNDVLTWDETDTIDSDSLQAHATYNVQLVAAIRKHSETHRIPAPWAK